MNRHTWTRRPTSARRLRPVRLALEPLEDRCVPATIMVLNTADSGAGSLRQAILTANNTTTNPGADTIVFDPSLTGQTIKITSAALPTITDPLTITGLGANALTVSGNNAFRVFNIAANVSVTITGLTVTAGSAGAGNPGGGILNNGVLSLTNVAVVGNVAGGVGGGIDSTGAGSQLTAMTCSFSSNTAGSEGGGIENDTASTATLTSCNVSSNTAGNSTNGAGIVNRGTMTITTSSINLNNGPGGTFFGGAILNTGSPGSLGITSSSIIANTSQGAGGGVWSSGTLLTIANTTIANNLSLGSSGGGGVRVTGGPLSLLNDTITNNTDASGAASNAGGVSFSGSTFTISNTIVAQNFATGGGPPDVRGAVAGGSVNNFIGIGDTNLTGIINGTAGNQIGAFGAAIDPQLGALQDNGGGLLTRLPRLGSPVIDTGNNAAAATLTKDERGFLRIIGTNVDIGATEFQPPQTTVTLTVSPTSPTPFREPLTLTATVAPAGAGPNNPVTGTVTFLVLNTGAVLGTATVDATGKAVFTTTQSQPAPLGTDQIAAQYQGDVNFGPSQSNVVMQQVSFRKITQGVFDPATGMWFLRDTTTAGAPDISFSFGPTGPGVFPVVGDWLGNGTFGVGVFIQATATFEIKFTPSGGAPDATFAFGPSGVGLPVAGDWGGTGKWGIGVFDPTTGNWFLRNELSSGLPDAGSFPYGAPGSTPVVGDWDGNGTFTIGVVEPGATWKIKNTNLAGSPDAVFSYGMANSQFVAGDWNGDGVWSPGEVEQDNGVAIWKLRNSNSSGAPDILPFAYGGAGVLPVAGSWIFPSLPEFAARGALPGGSAATITQQQTGELVMAALQRLQQAGVSPQILQGLTSTVAVVMPLGGTELGEARPTQHMIILDPTAAGQGWFVDPTPMQDEEFSGGQAIPGGPAAGRVDALTVVLHELAHMAGLSDDDGSPLMAGLLPPGTRRTDGLDAAFASLGG